LGASEGEHSVGGLARQTVLCEELLDSLRAAELQKAKGNEAFQRGDWKAAEQHFDAAVQADPRRLDAEFTAIIFCNRGAVRQKQGQAKMALDDFNAAVALSPQYAKALFRRGLIYLELERYRSAETDFEAVAGLSPGFVGLKEVQRRARMWSRQPPKRNFYAVLGVGFDVSGTELKRAYRAAALKWHPDKNIEKPELAERKFKEVLEAYETLSDQKLRRDYDYCGTEDIFGANDSGFFGGDRSNPFGQRRGGFSNGFSSGFSKAQAGHGHCNGRTWNSWHFG